jgi:hypothetical protein
MIRVCCYIGCGVVYGEKEPLSDNKTTYGLCQKHLKISLEETRAEMGKNGQQMNANERDHRTGRGKSPGQDGHPG